MVKKVATSVMDRVTRKHSLQQLEAIRKYKRISRQCAAEAKLESIGYIHDSAGGWMSIDEVNDREGVLGNIMLHIDFSEFGGGEVNNAALKDFVRKLYAQGFIKDNK